MKEGWLSITSGDAMRRLFTVAGPVIGSAAAVAVIVAAIPRTVTVALTVAGKAAADSSGFPGKKIVRPPQALHNQVRKLAKRSGLRTGDIESFHGLNLRSMPGVADVHRISDPFKLVSRQHHADRSTVWVGPAGHQVPIGPDTFTFIAGPCAVETASQTLEAAEMAKAAGASLLRGGAFKPRTSPYAFQGLGVKGLEILADVRETTGLEHRTRDRVRGASRPVAGLLDSAAERDCPDARAAASGRARLVHHRLLTRTEPDAHDPRRRVESRLRA